MYRIPKFIEREPKIVWFFTFKQFAFVGIAQAINFFLYFTWGKNNLVLFVLLALVLTAVAFASAFLRIEGKPLMVFLEDFLVFSLVSKKYLWQRKRIIHKIKKTKGPKEKVGQAPPLQIIEKSRLKDLSIKLKTKK